LSRIAAAGILRLALRWPALAVVLIASVDASWHADGTNRGDMALPVLMSVASIDRQMRASSTPTWAVLR
jgi:hypothetical protein